MKSLFLDTSVLLLTAGGAHSRRDACRQIIGRASRSEARLHASVEAGQEFLFHRLRKVDREAALADFDDLHRMVLWHDFDVDVLLESRRLVAGGFARGRDAVHAATALLAGFSEIISADSDFDGIPGLRRVDPAEA